MIARRRLVLVNLNQTEPRELIVRSGAYGEHLCRQVTAGGGAIAVNGPDFRVLLEPGAGGRLDLEVKRYALQTHACPAVGS